MRILFVTQEFPPGTHWGGIGTFASILAPALARCGASVEVLSVVRHQSRAEQTWHDGVAVHRRPLVRPPAVGQIIHLPHTWDRLSLAFNVRRYLMGLRRDFDVVLSPSWNAESFFLLKRRPAPVVTCVFSSASDILPMLGAKGADAAGAIAMEDATIAGADLVIGPPAQTRKVLASGRVSPARVVSIPCPVAPAAPASPTTERVISFVGRFEPRKSPETLIRAMPQVRASLPDAKLVLRGKDTSGPQRPSYAQYLRDLAAELGVGDVTEVIEAWGDPSEAMDLMRSSAVVAVPSRWESFGYVAAEAASLGRAVVSSDLPSFRDTVVDGETGRIATNDDPKAWACALLDVLQSPQRWNSMGSAAVHHVRTSFDPDRVAGDTLTALHRLARDG